MLAHACPAADAVPWYVTCGPALSPPGLGTCEQSCRELALPLVFGMCAGQAKAGNQGWFQQF